MCLGIFSLILLLAAMELKDEARKYWQAAAAERPDDPASRHWSARRRSGNPRTYHVRLKCAVGEERTATRTPTT